MTERRPLAIAGMAALVIALAACGREAGPGTSETGGSETGADETASGPGISGVRYLAGGDDGGDDAGGFARATAPRLFEFPADHGAHPGYRTEWWYFTGNVFDDASRHFGFELTIFRIALTPEPPPSESALATSEVWMGHLALTDTAARRFLTAERLSRGAAGLAGIGAGTPGGRDANAGGDANADGDANPDGDPGPGAPDEPGTRGNPLTVSVEDFRIAFEGNRVTLAASDAAFGLTFELTGLERIVAQGDAGLDAKGPEPGNASYYFSAPRLAVSGEIRSGDAAPVAVEGTAWMDREWSTSALSPEIEGWDWFALQLDDGRDLMFYRLRGRNGGTSPYSGGSIADREGNVTRLGADAVELEPLREWTSPATRIRYPLAWRMTVPAADLQLEIRPRLDDQELDLTVRYWEGAVSAAGTSDGAPVRAIGYLELAGY